MSGFIKIICLLVCLSAGLTAQKGADRPAAAAAFDDGVQLLLKGKPQKAIKPFRQAVTLDTGMVAARRFLGLAYELTGDFTGAADNYLRVIKRDTAFSRLLYYQLGKVYYKMGRPELALYYLETFQALQSREPGEFGRNGEEERPEELRVLEKLDNELRAAKITRDSTQFVKVENLYNLGFPINTQQHDLFPWFSNDLTTVLFTRRGKLGDDDLLVGKRKDRESDFSTSRFGQFNTTEPEGTLTMVRDGERIYFTLCKDISLKDQEAELVAKGGEGPLRKSECNLFAGWLVDGHIEDVTPLPEYISVDGFWETQASISCDEQQLFFVSDRQPSFGQTDIFMCQRQADGSWGEPQNLGEGVNTAEAEEAPFLSNDGGTLYFSSFGHYNLGEEDIFASYWDPRQQRFTQALNLGTPINSPHRELGFHLSSDGRTGFVASDRPGGWGKLDIYGFTLAGKLSSKPVTFVSGYVTDSITGVPLVDHRIPMPNGKVYFTNYDGRFFICAPAKQALPLAVDAPEYLPYERAFAIPEWPNLKPYRIDVLMRKKDVPSPPPPVIVEAVEEIPVDTIQRRTRIKKRNYTVLFNFDDASLTPRAIEGLQIFVDEVRNKNIMNIKVVGFTDNVGDAEFNIRLSQSRAKAVGIHLQTAGVKANEVSIIGMGELPGGSQRALNRKVEVTVTYRELVEE
jgi:flagellar motor protein MotB